MNKTKIYKITKYFRGGSIVFYIKTKEKITEDMLDSIGENTSGGHESGFRVHVTCVRKIPKGGKLLPRTIKHTIRLY